MLSWVEFLAIHREFVIDFVLTNVDRIRKIALLRPILRVSCKILRIILKIVNKFRMSDGLCTDTHEAR